MGSYWKSVAAEVLPSFLKNLRAGRPRGATTVAADEPPVPILSVPEAPIRKDEMTGPESRETPAAAEKPCGTTALKQR